MGDNSSSEHEASRINTFFQVLIENEVTMKAVPIDKQVVYIEPDDDFDFHAYRIILLIRICGTTKSGFFNNFTLYGRRKFSFFDFLIRYPFYLMEVIEKSGKNHLKSLIHLEDYEKERAFSPMVKYIRGPWDDRYDAIFNYMISKRLVKVKYDYFSKSQKAFMVSLTALGTQKANEIREIEKEWVERMEVINSIFPQKTSNESIVKYVQEKFPSLILGNMG